MQTFRYMFPHIRWDQEHEYNLADTAIKVGSKIMFRQDDVVRYGVVEKISSCKRTMDVYTYKFTREETITGCKQFVEGEKEDKVRIVNINQYLGHFMVTMGYVNKYVSLQLIKK